MQPNVAADLAAWKNTFQQELTEQLQKLRNDDDVYGFAIEVPEDPFNPVVVSAIGRESKLSGEQAGSSVGLDRRYSPVEWEYLAKGDAFGFSASLAQLEEITKNHRHVFLKPSCEYTPDGDEFKEALYTTCLDVMTNCNSAGAFGHIWFKVIFLSDGEHPIVRKSFNRLNTGRAKKEAHLLYNGQGFLSKLAHQLWMLYVRTVRRRKYR